MMSRLKKKFGVETGSLVYQACREQKDELYHMLILDFDEDPEHGGPSSS
jgi:hypothetical protein